MEFGILNQKKKCEVHIRSWIHSEQSHHLIWVLRG